MKNVSAPIMGWHFLAEDRRTQRTNVLIEAGTIEKHKGALKPCESGLHFSPRLLGALRYAPGPILREVRLSGSIVMDTDKGVASIRETLWVDDVTPMLRAFARWCALSVIDKWNPPPIVLKYLRDGEEADRAAAWAAAWDAARAAARAAAWAAARAAARAAAWDAAWDAAWAAAGDAAWAAALDAAWAAARDAAWAAAGDAAWEAQSARLDQMLAEFREGKREWRFS
jgi:hypothetical protein